MTPEQIETVLSGHKERLSAFGVRSLKLFGSVAQGTHQEDSDVDVLVEFEGPATFSGYMGLSDFLESVLGRKVDLVTSKALREPLRDEILREAKRVA